MLEAGKAIMEVYHSKDFGITLKGKDDPVTLADMKSNHILIAGITAFSAYPIISEEETSYSGCIRKNYKISVKDDATQNEIRDVLLDVYNKKKSLSDKTTIFVYKDSQKAQLEKEAVLYRGRLFMNPSCDESDEYQIDFDYWNIGEYTE